MYKFYSEESKDRLPELNLQFNNKYAERVVKPNKMIRPNAERCEKIAQIENKIEKINHKYFLVWIALTIPKALQTKKANAPRLLKNSPII